MKFTPYITVGFSHGYGGEFSTSISMACANLSDASAIEVREELSKLVERFDEFRRQHPSRPDGPNVGQISTNGERPMSVIPRYENIDKHPMRYSPIVSEIERILMQRLYYNRIDGYVLETAIQIAELSGLKHDFDKLTLGLVATNDRLRAELEKLPSSAVCELEDRAAEIRGLKARVSKLTEVLQTLVDAEEGNLSDLSCALSEAQTALSAQ